MKTNFLMLMLVLSIIATSCSTNDDAAPLETTYYDSLTALFDANGPKQQSFTLDNATGGIIVGAEGTVITFPSRSIVDGSNNDVSGTVTVTLKEYYHYKDFVYDVLPTVENGNWIVSGGALDIDVNQNGNPLYFKTPQSGVTAILPNTTDAKAYVNSMMQFKGERLTNESQEPVTWQIFSDVAVPFDPTGPTYTMENMSQYLINCDAFYLYPGARTQFETKLNGITNPTSTSTLWFFPDGIPIVIYIYSVNNGNLLTYPNSIPVGITGTLVAFSTEKGYLEVGTKNITVATNDYYELSLEPMTQAQLDDILTSLE